MTDAIDIRARLAEAPPSTWVDLRDAAAYLGLFRRSFNDLLRQITSGEVVRSMTGHSSAAMTEHYSHVGAREKAEAVERALRVVRGGRGE